MKRNLPFLKHIFDEKNFLLKVSKGLDYDDFMSEEGLGVDSMTYIIGVRHYIFTIPNTKILIPWTIV